jgi:8-oxo-dGTP pyrophosphatase MutT (NUDIX family)
MRYRKAVFILAYAKTKKGIKYLLLKRKLHWKGWEFPKGKIEKNEPEEKAVKRELKEETGHKAAKIRKFNFSGKYRYNKIFPDRPGIKGQTFSLYSARIKKSGKIDPDTYEHCGFKWVDFSRAIKMLKWPNQRKSLRIVDSWLKHNEI